ncbi:hypothetical protein [Streptomyces bacillaris]|uniref:hypothetical protein n=1 Tax=Streptomyces bacillaris TaxID=68179 RepID=UPI0036372F2C
MTPLALAVLAAIAGYCTGRYRPGTTVLGWAETQIACRSSWSPCYWAAVPLALAAVAGAWIIHPRRTARNVRAFRRELHATAPPYRMNPQTSRDTNSP